MKKINSQCEQYESQLFFNHHGIEEACDDRSDINIQES